MIGQSYFPENFSMLGNPIASVPLSPNAPNYTTTVGMQSLLQAMAASTRDFEAAAYNPTQENSPYSSNFDAPQSFQPQFPSYSPYGLESDPYFNSMGNSSSGSGSSGFSQLGQTNPYFNAGFTGAMSGFFGNEGNQGSQGSYGQWQQPQSNMSWGQTGQNTDWGQNTGWGQSGQSNGCPANNNGSSSSTSSTGTQTHHHHHHHHHGGGSSSGGSSSGSSAG